MRSNKQLPLHHGSQLEDWQVHGNNQTANQKGQPSQAKAFFSVDSLPCTLGKENRHLTITQRCHPDDCRRNHKRKWCQHPGARDDFADQDINPRSKNGSQSIEKELDDLLNDEIYDMGYTDPKDYNSIGLTEYNEKNYKDALGYFKKAVELDEDYIYSLYNIGLCYYYLGEYEEAIEQYTVAINSDPTYSNALFERAFVNNELENYQEAIDDYTKFIELDPTNTKAYTKRGLAKHKLDDDYGACLDWELSNSLGGDASEFIDKYFY